MSITITSGCKQKEYKHARINENMMQITTKIISKLPVSGIKRRLRNYYLGIHPLRQKVKCQKKKSDPYCKLNLFLNYFLLKKKKFPICSVMLRRRNSPGGGGGRRGNEESRSSHISQAIQADG